MFTQLSSNQQGAVDKTCSECGTGTVRQKDGRYGPYVECDHCGHKLRRPRGKSFGPGGAHGGAAQGGGEQAQQASGGSGPEGGNAKEGPSVQDVLEGAGMGQGTPQSGGGKPANPLEALIAETAKKAIAPGLEKLAAKLLAEMQRVAEQAQQQQGEQEERKPRELKLSVTHKMPDASEATVEIANPHPALAEVLRRLEALRQAGMPLNVLLVGPSGSGKTTLAAQVAEALKCAFSAQSYTSGVTEGAIFGRPTLDGKFAEGAFSRAYESETVYLGDEIDGADPNVLLGLNTAIENGVLNLPHRQLKRHGSFVFLAAGNTFGTGADLRFVGRNQLDAAFLSRFAGGVVFVGYSRDLEERLVPEKTFRENFWLVRERVEQHKLRRVFGMRELVRGAALLRYGYAERDVFNILTPGWTADEKQKVGLA